MSQYSQKYDARGEHLIKFNLKYDTRVIFDSFLPKYDARGKKYHSIHKNMTHAVKKCHSFHQNMMHEVTFSQFLPKYDARY